MWKFFLSNPCLDYIWATGFQVIKELQRLLVCFVSIPPIARRGHELLEKQPTNKRQGHQHNTLADRGTFVFFRKYWSHISDKI